MNKNSVSMRASKLWLLGLATAACAHSAFAQTTPTLEFFSGAGNPTASGPTVSNQVITFQNNTDNPTSNTVATYSPTTTATFSLSNQQYGAGSNSGVMFGAQTTTNNSTTPGAFALFPLVNGLSGSSNGNYTSGNTAGSGLDVTVNRSVELGTDLQYVANSSTTGRLQYADLTITFNRAVANPVLHLTGLGTPGNGNNTVGSSTELDVLTSGVTISKLSGSTELSVSGTSITNTSTAPTSATGSGAASGSVKVATASAGITSLVLRVYLRKPGNVSTSTNAYTDGWLIGVSALTPASTLPVTLASFTAQALPTKAAQLAWTTASELDNDHFEVERSVDGTSFQQIGRVAGQGSKASATTYRFADAGAGELASGLVYYRLRQVDLNGTATYSPVRTVAFTAAAAGISLAPNPATSTTELDLSQLPAGSYQVAVLDLTGRPLLHQELAAGLAHTLPLSQLPSGQYMVLVRGGSLSLSKRLSKL